MLARARDIDEDRIARQRVGDALAPFDLSLIHICGKSGLKTHSPRLVAALQGLAGGVFHRRWLYLSLIHI